MSTWAKKHIFGMQEFSRKEIEIICDVAKAFKEIGEREVKKTPALRGKTVVNLFFENSTRTRTSFELSAKRLSADVVNFSSSSSSIAKGETIVDTLKNFEAYNPDIFVIRIGHSACLEFLSRFTKASIINAGDGKNEHPTQALLDLFTVMEVRGSLDNLKVVIVGDILHSRVARSNIFGFQKFGANITVCGPLPLIPYQFNEMGVTVEYDFDRAIQDADVLIMLRMQKERQKHSYVTSIRDYVRHYSLTPARYRSLKKDCLVMHPGPVNWDIEVSSVLKETVHPLILRQVENGLAVRMAVLYLIAARGE